MPFNIKHIEKPRYLHLELSSMWSQDDSRQIISQISSRLSPGHNGRVLIDAREQFHAMSTLAVYNEARELATKLLGNKIRVAILASRDIDQPSRFFETVARNRGIDLRVFNALNEAVDWLMGETATIPSDADHA